MPDYHTFKRVPLLDGDELASVMGEELNKAHADTLELGAAALELTKFSDENPNDDQAAETAVRYLDLSDEAIVLEHAAAVAAAKVLGHELPACELRDKELEFAEKNRQMEKAFEVHKERTKLLFIKGIADGYIPEIVSERLDRLDTLIPIAKEISTSDHLVMASYASGTGEVAFYWSHFPDLFGETAFEAFLHEATHVLSAHFYGTPYTIYGRTRGAITTKRIGLVYIMGTPSDRNIASKTTYNWLNEAMTEHIAVTLYDQADPVYVRFQIHDDDSYYSERGILKRIVEVTGITVQDIVNQYFDEEREVGSPTFMMRVDSMLGKGFVRSISNLAQKGDYNACTRLIDQALIINAA